MEAKTNLQEALKFFPKGFVSMKNPFTINPYKLASQSPLLMELDMTVRRTQSMMRK